MCRLFYALVAYAAIFVAVDIVSGSTAQPHCHPLFRIPISKLSPDDNYNEKDSVNGTVCICDVKPCFLKCCPEGFSSSLTNSRSCVPDDDRSFELSTFEGGPYPSDYSLLTGFPCNESYWEADYEALEPNGTLLTADGVQKPGEFCLEYSQKESKYLPLVCFPDETDVDDDSDDEKYSVYPIGMLISIPFYLATFIVYAIIPELRGTLHGMSFMCHIAVVIIGYSILAAIQLNIFSLAFTPVACISLAYIMQFAFLATFFWMNVMCFDIWWTFSSLKKPGGSVRERDMKKFLLYSVYAWGFPLLILTATLIADYTPLLPKDSRFRPDMGVNKCFFRTAPATWLYMYGPIAILIVANLIMFAFTAKKIFLHTRETQVLKSADSQRHDSKDRERFNLYLKLFIVMGVNWVAELISWADAKNKVFYITDITNTLQGFIIFVIFVCKRRVLRLLEAAVCPGRAARRNALNSSSRSRNTTASVVNGSTRGAQLPETVQLKTAAHDSDSNM